MSGTTRSPAATLRSLARSRLLLVQVVLGLVTLGLAWWLGMPAAVAGVVLMQVVTTAAVIGPWGVPDLPDAATRQQVAKVARRVDRLGRDVARGDQLGDLDHRVERLASQRQVTRLEERVDALGARMVANTERTRVELLDALGADRADRARGADLPGAADRHGGDDGPGREDRSS